MSSTHDSLSRAYWLSDLKSGIAIKSAFRLVIDTAPSEYATEDELEAALDLFEEILHSEKTMPQKCKPEDCEGCEWYNFCELWGFQQLIRESEKVLHDYNERRRIEEEERKKQKDTKQTWNAETLSTLTEKETLLDSSRLLAKTELTTKGYASNILEDKTLLSSEEKVAFDAIEAKRLAKNKKQNTGQTWTAKDGWHNAQQESE